MLNVNKIISNSAIVVAHPDDEIIWMSSIVSKVDSILICYQEELSTFRFGINKLVDSFRRRQYRSDSHQGFMSEMGLNREKALRSYPLKNIKWLGLVESGSYGAVDWKKPSPNELGIHLDFPSEHKTILNQIWGGRKNKGLIKRRYAENFDILKKRLTTELQGVSNVFTHNPWGEYGHPDHIQVNKVLRVLQKDLGFNLFVTTYSSHEVLSLAYQYLRPGSCLKEYVSIETNKKLAREIMSVYVRYNCWTYHENWAPCSTDMFIPCPEKSLGEPPIGILDYPPGLTWSSSNGRLS